MRRLGKKGAEYQYSVIFSLIIGIMILAIFLFWIYTEYFTQEDADLQLCRQSVEVRASVPNIDVYATLIEFKDEFPLKCKTEVVTIDYEDVSKLETEIANTIAGCWNLFGEGKYTLFPSSTWGRYSTCVPCARIHLTPSVRDYYVSLYDDGDFSNDVNIYRGLQQPFQGSTYFNYLQNGDGPFPAFDIGNGGVPFNLQAEEFSISETPVNDVIFKNRLSRATEGGASWYNLFGLSFDVYRVNLPQFYDPRKGDLLVFYGSATSDNEHNNVDDIGESFPYIFYTHSRSNYLNYFNTQIIDGSYFADAQLCQHQEGIPA